MGTVEPAGLRGVWSDEKACESHAFVPVIRSVYGDLEGSYEQHPVYTVEDRTESRCVQGCVFALWRLSLECADQFENAIVVVGRSMSPEDPPFRPPIGSPEWKMHSFGLVLGTDGKFYLMSPANEHTLRAQGWNPFNQIFCLDSVEEVMRLLQETGGRWPDEELIRSEICGRGGFCSRRGRGDGNVVKHSVTVRFVDVVRDDKQRGRYCSVSGTKRYNLESALDRPGHAVSLMKKADGIRVRVSRLGLDGLPGDLL